MTVAFERISTGEDWEDETASYDGDGFIAYEDEREVFVARRTRRWTTMRIIIMLVLLVVAAAIVVFVVLPLVDSYFNPAPALQLPTPIQT